MACSALRSVGRFGGRAAGVISACVLAGWLLVPTAVSLAQAVDPLAPPPNRPGVRQEERLVALAGGTVHAAPGRVIEGGTVVLRGAVIQAVLEGGAKAPAGAEVIDVRGRHVYPALIDAFVEVDAPGIAPDAPGAHWSTTVTPQRDVLDGAGLSADVREQMRGLGFGAANIVPKGNVFGGTTAVVSLADVGGDRSASRAAVYRARAAHAMSFETDRSRGGGGTGRWDSYPDSQMGAIALIRQTLLDAAYRKQRLGAGLEGGASALDALDGPSPLLFAVDDELEVLRAGKVASEAGRAWVVRGSGTEFERLDAVAGEKDRAGLIVPVNFPEPPRVTTASEANAVDLRALMAWEQAPTNARRLVQAGVPVALTSHGLKDRGAFLGRVRLAVRHGLSEDDALAALTTVPAKMLGVDKQLGTLEAGKRANVIVTDKPLLARGTRVLESWIDGVRDEIKADQSALAGLYAMAAPGGVEKPDETWAVRVDEGGAVTVMRWSKSEPEKKPEAAAEAKPDDKQVAQPVAKPGAEPGAEPAPKVEPKPEAPARDAFKLTTSTAKNVVVDRGRLAFTFENKPFGEAGVWSLSGLAIARDAQVRVTELRGDGRRPDGTMFTWSARPDERSAWLGTWRVIEADGKAFGPEADRQVRLEISPAQAGLSVKIRFTGFDKKDAEKSDTVEATLEKLDGGVLTYEHDLKPVGAEGVSADRVTLDDSPGAARLRGQGLIKIKDKPEMPHAFTAARDEGEPEAPVSAPADLPGLPFGPYAVKTQPAQERVALVNATIWTSGPEGIIEGGSVLIEDGKIKAVIKGKVEPPPSYVVIDCAGKHITPGIIDCHSHTGISKGVNEAGQAVTAEVRIGDVTNPDAISWYRQLAAGVTTVNSLHGSANAIGGQNQVNKNRWGAPKPDDLHFAGAIPGIKFALGENVKQSNWGDSNTWRYPQTRMGVEGIIRDRFTAAREYDAAKKDAKNKNAPFRVDLELEALAEILRGERLVHCHSYRQDEILMLARVARDFGFKIGTYQHILEGYKVAEAVAESGGGSCFADWWGYKVEVQDAIPQAGPIMHERGAVVSFNSDSDEMARRMNVEAAKAHKYSLLPDGTRSVSKADALKFVTINPARQLQIDKQVGSLEAGKDADLVVWNGEPLSSFSFAERTFVDGRELWSRESDTRAQKQNEAERTRLIQKVLAERARRPARPADADKADPLGKPGPGATPPSTTAFEGGLITRMRIESLRLIEQQRMDRLRRGEDADGAVAGECGCDAP